MRLFFYILRTAHSAAFRQGAFPPSIPLAVQHAPASASRRSDERPAFFRLPAAGGGRGKGSSRASPAAERNGVKPARCRCSLSASESWGGRIKAGRFLPCICQALSAAAPDRLWLPVSGDSYNGSPGDATACRVHSRQHEACPSRICLPAVSTVQPRSRTHDAVSERQFHKMLISCRAAFPFSKNDPRRPLIF